MNQIFKLFQVITTSIKMILKISVIFLFIGLSIYFALSGNDTATIVYAAIAVYTSLLIFPELFKEINFFGLNVKLKELENTIDELKMVTKTITKGLLGTAKTSNRYSTDTIAREHEKMFEEVKNILNKLEFTKHEIDEIISDWMKWTEFDYLNDIKGIISNKYSKLEKSSQQSDNENIESFENYKFFHDNILPLLRGGIEENKILMQYEDKIIDMCKRNEELKHSYDKYKHYMKYQTHKESSI